MERGEDSGQGIKQSTGQDPSRDQVQGGGFTRDASSGCICPSCGFSMPQESGVQCYNKHCPKCGTIMTNKR
jgi:hypothetical protein